MNGDDTNENENLSEAFSDNLAPGIEIKSVIEHLQRSTERLQQTVSLSQKRYPSFRWVCRGPTDDQTHTLERRRAELISKELAFEIAVLKSQIDSLQNTIEEIDDMLERYPEIEEADSGDGTSGNQE